MEKPWFVRRKRLMGYRIHPVAWQGWVIVVAFTLGIIAVTLPLRLALAPHLTQVELVITQVATAAMLVVVLLVVTLKFSVSGEAWDAMRAEEMNKKSRPAAR